MNDPPERGGMDVRAVHPLEGALMQMYQLDAEQLRRLAVFTLAHMMVDQVLTVAVIAARYPFSGPAPTLEEVRRVAGWGFAQRLWQAKAVLSPPSYRTARDLNAARNAFLHRGVIPAYRDKLVTTEEGLFAVLNEVVPFLTEEHDRAAAAQRRWNEARRSEPRRD